MTRYLLLVIGLCVLSLVGVFLLSPSAEQKLERALSRLPADEALVELDRLYVAGDRTASLMLRRAELLMAGGSFDAARETLGALAKLPDTALVAQEAEAQMELDLGDVAAAIPPLSRALALDPAPERLDRLARLYELVRDSTAETALLAAAEPAQLTDRAARRLLELQIAAGDMAASEVLLRARADTPGAARSEMRGALVELLVGSDRAEESAVLAARWFALDQDAEALALATERLLERGAVREAEVLASAAVESGLSGSRATIPVFAGAGHGLTARRLLSDWLLVHPGPTPEDSMALLGYAEEMHDFSAVLSLLRTGSPGDFDPSFVLGVVKGSYARNGLAALPELRRYLIPEVLAGDPLFAAELSLAEQRPQAAVRYLELAAVQDLQPWQSDVWAAMMRRISAGPVRDRLFAMRTAGSSPAQP